MTILESSAAAIITRPPEIIACLKLQLSTRSVFIVFDPHPRPSHPNGAGATVSTSLEDTARRLTDLLPSADLQDGILQWQSQLLAGHVFVPNIVDTSTTAMWQAVLESSLAQLSMQAEMRSQNKFQVNEQKRLVSELKEAEERCQRQERTILELRSSASNTHSHHTANSQWPPPTSPPPPFSPSSNNPFLNSSFSGNTAASHSTISRSGGPQDTHGISPPPVFNWDDSLSYAMRLQGEFDSEVRGLSAERNTFTRDTTEPHSNGSRSVGPHDTRGGPSTPLIDLDDSLTYARRLQSEFDSEARALSAQRNTLTRDTTIPHTTGSQTAGPHNTRRVSPAPAPLIDLDDSLSYARRLQSAFDSEERALSAERNALNRYATMAHSTSSRSAGSHDTRAGPSTPRVDWVDSLSYAERLQKEFDNEDRALSAERIDLSHTIQQVFQCGICMEEMPEDSVARPDPCGHSFCRECMRGYVSTRVEEHRFPILCPTCTASKGKGTSVTGGTRMLSSPLVKPLTDVIEISQAIALDLGLTDEQLNIWTEMEMNSFSVLLHCRKYGMPVVSDLVLTNHRDRCERSMFVARDEHEEETIIECPLPDCDHTWCKECQQTTELGGPQHSCDGTKELEHLMKEQGWKYCPCMPVLACCNYRSHPFLACKTPIQKVSGCNHMSVSF